MKEAFIWTGAVLAALAVAAWRHPFIASPIALLVFAIVFGLHAAGYLLVVLLIAGLITFVCWPPQPPSDH